MSVVQSETILQLLADPMVQTGLMAVAGALVTRVALRHHPAKRLFGQVLFFAALTALLLYHGIVPYQAAPPETAALQHVFVGIAKIIWWINAAWALIAFVRVFLIFEKQPREGRLIQDLVVGTIYLGALLSVVAYVFSVPVGTLVATSGVVAIIIGLALQSTLSDVFSGVALNIGRPYAVGDWIVLNDGIEGRVLETNWRATHLLNGANDLVVLPNSSLAKATLTNMSSPERSHGVKLMVSLLPTKPPRVLVEAMRDVLLSCNATLKSPPPAVQIKKLTGTSIDIELSFRVTDISRSGAARNELFDLIYRHALANDLKLVPIADDQAAPATMSSGGTRSEIETSRHRTTPLRLLDAVPLFATLTEDEKEVLAAAMVRRTFRKNEIVVEQGTTLQSLMVLRSGVAVVTRAKARQEIELGRLAPGDFFGEGGLLTGAKEPGTIKALTLVVIYEIAQPSLAPLMQDRPVIAEDLAMIFARRMDNERQRSLPESRAVEPGSVQRLVERMRHIFDIKHAGGDA
ncbi:mechanosensitive ion channel protein [Bosea caraganae]|uniref:Small-conductance mechanosensitive channel n=1 Tax=Bosea caraganae TaxID=2763117 RepID=A0A370LAP2_9HYPH|nr:mechanosensitive ion channel family protein [Bosea caraganae]RDJ27015.1 mechanosensitive ion channel protein [Bosea caraganae]RDJ29032.1 mechanosensitive ion channel protein [Bosea caraganae]